MGRGRKKKRNDATFSSKFDEAVLKSSKPKNARPQFDREAVIRKPFPDTTGASFKASNRITNARTNASFVVSKHDVGKNFQENITDEAIEMVVIDADSPTELSVSSENKPVLALPVSVEANQSSKNLTQQNGKPDQNLTFQELMNDQTTTKKKARSRRKRMAKPRWSKKAIRGVKSFIPWSYLVSHNL